MIYAVMIVGQGEAGRYLGFTLERATRWADKVHVALEPDVGPEELALAAQWADSTSELKCTASSNDSMAKDQAWLGATHAFRPTEDDYFAIIKPTETVQDPAAVRQAVKEFPGQAYQFKLYHLWDEDHVRVDGDWGPKLEANSRRVAQTIDAVDGEKVLKWGGSAINQKWAV